MRRNSTQWWFGFGPRAFRALAGALAAVLWLLAVPASAEGGRDASGLDPSDIGGWELPRGDLYAVTARGDNVWAVGYWGTVLRSTDGGATFDYGSTPTRETLFGVSFADDRTGWAVGSRGTLLKSSDGGATWSEQVARVKDEFGDEVVWNTGLFGVSAVSPTEAWAVGDLGVVLHTRDGGQRWEKVSIPAESLPDENLLERIFNAVDFTDASSGWIAGEFGTLLRTSDGGQTWVGQRELQGVSEEPYLFNLSVTPAKADSEAALATVGLAGTVLFSEDGGRTWAGRPVPTRAGLYAIANRGRSAVAAGDRGVIFVTSDAGATWKEAGRPRIFGWLGGVAYADDTHVFVVGAGGAIWRSEDGGRSFAAVGKANRAIPERGTDTAAAEAARSGQGE